MQIAKSAAKQLVSSQLPEFNLTGTLKLSEVEEGEEPKEFWERLGVKTEMNWREAYASLAGQDQGNFSQVQAFRFTSLSGSFEAISVLSPQRKSKVQNSFPILQEDLYNAQQPS